ncbi:MAG: TIGR02281 family clan AA aspartic protease [Sulfuritalea sp.]|nr:TIGR02281 family clan AA aspartic protease [Sulfuritalea sp.]
MPDKKDYYYDPKQFRRPKPGDEDVYSLDDSHIGAGPALNIRAIIFWMLALGGVFLLAFAYTGKSAVTANGNSLRVVMNQTGHFHIPGAVGPRQLNFLVDTGATTIAIPDSMRGALGVVGCESIVTLQTANGPVRGCATTLSAVDIGVFRLPNVKAVFMPNLKEPLLGMNAIGRFRMSQQAGMLLMTPLAGADVWMITPRVSPTESWPFYVGLAVLAVCGILGYSWFGPSPARRTTKPASVSPFKRSPYDQLLWACNGDQSRADKLIERYPLADKQRAAELVLKDIWR